MENRKIEDLEVKIAKSPTNKGKSKSQNDKYLVWVVLVENKEKVQRDETED